MKYYIYQGKLDGVIVYIGKGSGDRVKHLTSGISTCYDANKAHFEGKVVEVTILETIEIESDAYKRESELIKELQPSWNYQIRGVRASPLSEPKPYTSRGVQYMPKKRIKQWRAYDRDEVTRNKIHIGYYLTEEEALIAIAKYKAQSPE